MCGAAFATCTTGSWGRSAKMTGAAGFGSAQIASGRISGTGVPEYWLQAAEAVARVEDIAKRALKLAELLRLALTDATGAIDKRLSGK